MRITLIRHAQTSGNLLKRYIGCCSDEPLCPEGRKTAQGSHIQPQVAEVYTSGMLRTNQTAEILFPQAKIVEVAQLQEMNFGAFEGKNYLELADDQDYQAWLDTNCEASCPEGESKATFEARCTQAFMHIIENVPQDTVELYFVVHGGTIMSIVSNLATPVRDYFDCHVSFCQGYVLELLQTPEDPKRPLKVFQA